VCPGCSPEENQPLVEEPGVPAYRTGRLTVKSLSAFGGIGP